MKGAYRKGARIVCNTRQCVIH